MRMRNVALYILILTALWLGARGPWYEVQASAPPPVGHVSKIIDYPLVRIPAGRFLQGSPDKERGHVKGESPQHWAKITHDFLLGATEVTQAQWQIVMNETPSRNYTCGPNCPVDNVSWHDSMLFCNRLSKLEELTPCYFLDNHEVRWNLACDGYRLPTEAEWEYAVRAGGDQAFAYGKCLSTDKANYNGYSPLGKCAEGINRNGPLRVGSLTPNAWGLFDMHGNVKEWVWDWYGDYPNLPQTDPLGPAGGVSRVYRGGSWAMGAEYCRAAYRGFEGPGDTDRDRGLRLARTLKTTNGDNNFAALFPPRQQSKKLPERNGMNRIPGGSFKMGCSPGDSACEDNEYPAHEVIVGSFWLDRTEVTNEQYKKCAVAGGCKIPLDSQWYIDKPGDLPVVGVSWHQAHAYCKWVDKRLPTEAEWEFAARAGAAWPLYGPLADIAWQRGNCQRPQRVARKKPNPFGLYDMLGNAAEWVSDCYDEDYYAHSPVRNPWGPRSSVNKITRSGSWRDVERRVRASSRVPRRPTDRDATIGFRCARDAIALDYLGRYLY